MAQFFRAAFSLYSSSARSHPLLTLALTNATLCGASDIFAQSMAHRSLRKQLQARELETATNPSRTSGSDTTVPVVTSEIPLIDLDTDLTGPNAPSTPTSLDAPLGDTTTTTTTTHQAAGTSPTVAHTSTQHIDTHQPRPVHLAQLPSSFTLDYRRLANFAAFGFCVAPILNQWYTLLNTRFPVVTPVAKATTGTAAASVFNGPMVKAVLKRVVTDQCCWAPVGIGFFFVFISIAEGGGFEGIKEKFQQNYLPALTANYKVWPLVQFVNFFYVPLALQVPFVSFVSLFWNSYLSWLNSQRVGQTPDESNALGG